MGNQCDDSLHVLTFTVITSLRVEISFLSVVDLERFEDVFIIAYHLGIGDCKRRDGGF